MLECFNNQLENAVPITLVVKEKLEEFLKTQSKETVHFCEQTGFQANPSEKSFILDTQGNLTQVLIGVEKIDDIWNFADLPLRLPTIHSYYLNHSFDKTLLEQLMIVWGLGAYQFCRYKSCVQKVASLVLPKDCNSEFIQNVVTTIYLIRDLINTPTNDMLPINLAETIESLAKEYDAEFSQIIGDALLSKNFHGIHAVGRASTHEPRLIDLHWGDAKHPKLTLVGKGVCFDSGGLNLKSSNGMLAMKKDMGGAAHAIGLARMIMNAQLPIRLRLLIPAVENAVSGNAYRPGDVIVMRNGKTVEITNTDAEGRMILADTLTEACSDNPDLLIDFATLTGAARVALGTDIAVLFSNDESRVQELMQVAKSIQDPIWSMPLYQPYRSALDSSIADITNCATDVSYGGAIHAALFLKEFVSEKVDWMHFDLMALNTCSRPGRPKGGEAQAVRAVFLYLLKHFLKN